MPRAIRMAVVTQFKDFALCNFLWAENSAACVVRSNLRKYFKLVEVSTAATPINVDMNHI